MCAYKTLFTNPVIYIKYVIQLSFAIRFTTIYFGITWLIGTTVSLSQLKYLVEESNKSATGVVTLSSRTSENVTVEVTISDGSANGNVKY